MLMMGRMVIIGPRVSVGACGAVMRMGEIISVFSVVASLCARVRWPRWRSAPEMEMEMW